jgi:ureidoacrylate peracid hydrolase
LKEYYGKTFYDQDHEILAPHRTALIVVDVQNDMGHPDGAFGKSEITAMVPRVAEMVAAARSHGVLIVWLRNTVLPNGLSDSPAWLAFRSRHGFASLDFTIKGTWGHELMEPLQSLPGDAVVDKHRSSGFAGTDLDSILRSNGIESVVVCGCMTEGCVESTVRDAAFCDYYPVVIEDLVRSNTPRYHQLSVEVMSSQFRMRTAEQVTAVWSGAAT